MLDLPFTQTFHLFLNLWEDHAEFSLRKYLHSIADVHLWNSITKAFRVLK